MATQYKVVRLGNLPTWALLASETSQTLLICVGLSPGTHTRLFPVVPFLSCWLVSQLGNFDQFSS